MITVLHVHVEILLFKCNSAIETARLVDRQTQKTSKTALLSVNKILQSVKE